MGRFVSAFGLVEARLSRRDGQLGSDEFRAADATALPLLEYRVDGASVLALESRDRGQPFLDDLEPTGLPVEVLGVAADLAQQVLTLDRQRLRARRQRRELAVVLRRRVEARAARDDRTQAAGIVVGQCLIGPPGSAAEPLEVAQAVALCHKRRALVLPGVHPFDLAQLELEQVELALACSGELGKSFEVRARVAQGGPRRLTRCAPQRLHGPARAVQDLELRRGEHQAPVLVLAVERQQPGGQLAELADRDRAAAETGPCAPVGADPSGEHELTGVGGQVLGGEPVGELEAPST